MIKELLQRLGLVRPTKPTVDEHITYQGDHVSLQRKHYPVQEIDLIEEYSKYSDIAWSDTVFLLAPSESKLTDIPRNEVNIEEAIKLLQDGYVACPF